MNQQNNHFLFSLETVAITGATGYIAETLIELLLKKGIHVHAIARNEGKLIALKNKFPTIDIFPCPIEDYFLLKRACQGCEGIFHLAAVKDIAIAEKNAIKTVQSNVTGSMNVLQISVEQQLKFVITSSSDKAQCISGVYGASKYIVEKMFQEFAEMNGASCRYRSIRFGNIFHSTGSVLDVWRKMLAEKLEIEITDPSCTRFFWTRELAVEEMLNCLENQYQTSPYIPQLKSVKLETLLQIMLELYGNEKSTWKEVGLRTGENKHEFMTPEVSSEFAAMWSETELRAILANANDE